MLVVKVCLKLMGCMRFSLVLDQYPQSRKQEALSPLAKLHGFAASGSHFRIMLTRNCGTVVVEVLKIRVPSPTSKTLSHLSLKPYQDPLCTLK